MPTHSSPHRLRVTTNTRLCPVEPGLERLLIESNGFEMTQSVLVVALSTPLCAVPFIPVQSVVMEHRLLNSNKALVSQLDALVKKNGIPVYVKAWLKSHERLFLRQKILDTHSTDLVRVVQAYIKNYHHHSYVTVKSQKSVGKKGSTRRDHTMAASPVVSYDAQTKIGNIVLKACVVDFDFPVHARAVFTRIVSKIRRALDSWELAGMTRLILDFRQHGGGNMWPLIEAFARYLEGIPLFAWSNKSKPEEWMVLHKREKSIHVPTGDTLRENFSTPDEVWPKDYGGYLKDDRIRVAVILGTRTASSGEIVACCFVGKKNVKSFGSQTAGALSANVVYDIHVPGDKAVYEVVLTIKLVVPITMSFEQHLVPDVQCVDPVQEATKWLMKQ